jgi:hypothetical protein
VEKLNNMPTLQQQVDAAQAALVNRAVRTELYNQVNDPMVNRILEDASRLGELEWG